MLAQVLAQKAETCQGALLAGTHMAQPPGRSDGSTTQMSSTSTILTKEDGRWSLT